MGKNKIFFGAVLATILIISMGFASAGMFDFVKNMFSKGGITGNPIYGGSDTSRVVYYQFQESSYSNGKVSDSSASSNTGKATPGATSSSTGVDGKSIQLNGVSDYVDLNSSSSVNIVGPFSVSTWINFNSLPVGGQYPNIVGKFSDYKGYGLMYSGGSGVSGLIGTGNGWKFSSTFLPQVGKWYNFVAVYNGSVFMLYVDGTLYGTPVASSAPVTTSAAVSIGKHYSSPSAYGYIDAKIDEVMIYNRALSASEIAILRNSQLANLVVGNVTNPTNGAPTISITSPVNGASYISPATIIINATASDSNGNITSVNFYNGNTLLATDTTLPYSYVWSSVSAGTKNIIAQAVDNQWLTTNASISVIVSNPNVTNSTKVDAVCGSAINTCTKGTLNDINDSSAYYLWQCLGTSGGINASCSIQYDFGYNCVDSDGSNIFTKGRVTRQTVVAYDQCYLNLQNVYEYYCADYATMASVGTECPLGFVCNDGACVNQDNLPQNMVCADSDAGMNDSKLGITTLITPQGNASKEDACTNQSTLSEYYCNNNKISLSYISCLSGCSNGVCISQASSYGEFYKLIGGIINIYANNLIFQDDNGVSIFDIESKELKSNISSSIGMSPKIYGKYIVYGEGLGELYLYNIDTGQKLLIAAGRYSYFNPWIDKNYVIYGSYNSGYDLFLYDINTGNTTLITNGVGGGIVSDGKIYWLAGNFIKVYDIATKNIRIMSTSSASYKESLSAYNGKMVWTDYRNSGSAYNNADIYYTDLETDREVQITTDMSLQQLPFIHGNKIAWIDYRNGDVNDGLGANVYSYDLVRREERKITSSRVPNPVELNIYNSTLALVADSKIFLFNLSSSVNQTTSLFRCSDLGYNTQNGNVVACPAGSPQPYDLSVCSNVTNTCTDQDGLNYYFNSYVSYGTSIKNGLSCSATSIGTGGGGGTQKDICLDSTILGEAVCNEGGIASKVEFSCPNGCSGGACVNVSNTCTSGCNYNSACVPYSYRKNGLYCDVDGNMKVQRVKVGNSTAVCDNNYECSSNVCSAGSCVEVQELIGQTSAFRAFVIKSLCRLGTLVGQDYNQCLASNLGVSSSGGGGGGSSSNLFPSPFVVNGVADYAIVVGTTGNDATAAQDINLYLSSLAVNGNSGTLVVTDADVSQVTNKNLIVVATSCSNLVASKLLGSEIILCGTNYTAKTGLVVGEGMIEVFTSPYSTGKIAMLLSGYNREDTVNMAMALETESISTNVGKKYVQKAGSTFNLV